MRKHPLSSHPFQCKRYKGITRRFPHGAAGEGGINALFARVPVAQHRVNLAALPGDDRRKEEHQTAGPAHLLLPIASLRLPPEDRIKDFTQARVARELSMP